MVKRGESELEGGINHQAHVVFGFLTMDVVNIKVKNLMLAKEQLSNTEDIKVLTNLHVHTVLNKSHDKSSLETQIIITLS